MSSLKSYRDGIRALRESGADFSAANGYKLSGGLSRGQKSAITRALNRMDSDPAPREPREFGGRHYSTRDDDGGGYDAPDLPNYRDGGDDGEDYDQSFFDDGYGDNDADVDWDDMSWFDFDDADDLDVDGDYYSEQ